MIQDFAAGKIRKIHFRNVNAPLPHFVETFMDNGYYDVWKIMKAVRGVNCDGIVIIGHLDDPRGLARATHMFTARANSRRSAKVGYSLAFTITPESLRL